MKKSRIIILFIFCFFIIFSVHAENEPEIYNRGEKVYLSHGLINRYGDYYIHINDLTALGLTVSEEGTLTDEPSEKKYIITSNDFFGIENEATITITRKKDNISFIIDSSGNLIQIVENNNTSFGKMTFIDTTNSDYIVIGPVENIKYPQYDDTLKESISVKSSKRASKQIGERIMSDEERIPTYPDLTDENSGNEVINIDNEFYISSEYIGKELSHKYKAEDNKIEFYIANTQNVIFETTVGLTYENMTVPANGWNVNIYAANKTGEGNTLNDFKIFAETSCIIPKNERETSCMFEIPAENITDKNFYYIANFGERFFMPIEEFDFSAVGKVTSYTYQTKISYSVEVILPEVDTEDVGFTFCLSANKNTFSQKGIIKSGELSTVVAIENLPYEADYDPKILFDTNKYLSSYLNTSMTVIIPFDNIGPKDISCKFTPELAPEILCTVSLPDDFVCDTDLEVDFRCRLNTDEGELHGIVMGNELNKNKPVKIILNNENRTVKFPVYSVEKYGNPEPIILEYEIKNSVNGLCQTGYVKDGSSLTSNNESAMAIEESGSIDVTLLKKKNITVNVSRPPALSEDNDVYAEVQIAETIDFTQTPLIKAGERFGSFSFELVEDQVCTMLINNITGDENIFNYCWYVEENFSPAYYAHRKPITYNDDVINIELIECNNVSVAIESNSESDLYTLTATCEMYNGQIIELSKSINNKECVIKIPDDTKSYSLNVQTRAKVKSYYISDGISTNNQSEAVQIPDISDKYVNLKYIEQNPTFPIEISLPENQRRFYVKNTSDYIVNLEFYIAYYDEDDKLISIKKGNISGLWCGFSTSILYSESNDNVKTVKVFAWETNGLKPVSIAKKKSVNQ